MTSAKILVVEDEVIVARDISDILKKQGYDVPAIALSGKQAIQKAGQLQPDLVLMDIVLKGDVDGIEAAEQIRRRFDIPVIYLTAYTDEQTVKRAKVTEPFGYITKPFDKRQLCANIEMALYKHKAEKLLRKEKDKAKKYLDVAGVMLVAIDAEQRVGLINKKGCDILGYKEEEIIAKNWFDNFLPERIRNETKAVFEKLIRADVDAPEYRENPILTKSGDERLIAWHNTVLRDEKGGVIAMLSSGEDITERKQAEDVIAKLAKFPDEDPYPVLRISGHGTVIYANKASAILLKVWGCRVGQSLPDRWNELLMDALSSGQNWQTEAKYDGRIFSLTFAPIVDANYVNVYGLDITERKKAEDELVEYQAKLKAMASKILMTQERERQRLAMGLHDEVCQKLVLTKLALDSSMKLVSDSNVLALLRIACEGIGDTIQKADSLTFELSSPVLQKLGFVIALEKYLTEEIRQKHGIEYELESDEQLGTLQDEIKNCLFRVTRELLTNVVKHAHAHKIKVSVRKDCERIYVSVQDDGTGFKDSETSSTVSRTTRFGLFSVREQLEYLGGHLEIESEPGRGTTATVVVPLTKKAIV